MLPSAFLKRLWEFTHLPAMCKSFSCCTYLPAPSIGFSIIAIIVGMYGYYFKEITNMGFFLSYLLNPKSNTSTQAASHVHDNHRVTWMHKMVETTDAQEGPPGTGWAETMQYCSTLGMLIPMAAHLTSPPQIQGEVVFHLYTRNGYIAVQSQGKDELKYRRHAGGNRSEPQQWSKR